MEILILDVNFFFFFFQTSVRGPVVYVSIYSELFMWLWGDRPYRHICRNILVSRYHWEIFYLSQQELLDRAIKK